MLLTQVQRLESLKQQEKKSEESPFQQTLHEAVQKTKPYNQESECYKRITHKLAVFVAAGNVTNRVVEDEQFRALLKELDERYPVPGRTAIEREMNKLLIDLKPKMEAVLQSAQKIAITTQMYGPRKVWCHHFWVSQHISFHRRTTADTV